MDIDLQEPTKVNNTKDYMRYSFKVKISTESDKRSKTQADSFTTCLHVNSLDDFKKQKHVNATIKDPIQ